MKEKSNHNSPFGISWNELRKELFTPEEIAECDARIRALEGLQQIQDGKTKNFNEVCERLENKYAKAEDYTLHRIKSVNPLPNYKLNIQFEEGETKIYDVSLLFDKWTAFKCFIEEPELFEVVKVDKGGYGIVWNDELDLSADELYENGTTI